MSKLKYAYLLNIDLFGIAKSHHPQQSNPHTHTPTHQHHRHNHPPSLHSLWSLYCDFWSVYESKFMACHALISSGSLYCMSEITKPRQFMELRSADVRNCIWQRTLGALIVRIFNNKLGSQKKTCQRMRFSSDEMLSIRDKKTSFDIQNIRYEFSLISWERTYFGPF